MQVEQPPSQKREGAKQRRLDRSGRAKMKPPNKQEGGDGQHPCKHQPDNAKFRVLRIETRSEENRDEGHEQAKPRTSKSDPASEALPSLIGLRTRLVHRFLPFRRPRASTRLIRRTSFRWMSARERAREAESRQSSFALVLPRLFSTGRPSSTCSDSRERFGVEGPNGCRSAQQGRF